MIASDIIYVLCYRVHDLYVLSLAIAQAYALVKTSLQTVPIRQNRRKKLLSLVHREHNSQ